MVEPFGWGSFSCLDHTLHKLIYKGMTKNYHFLIEYPVPSSVGIIIRVESNLILEGKLTRVSQADRFKFQLLQQPS